jgi:hypothetical protein
MWASILEREDGAVTREDGEDPTADHDQGATLAFEVGERNRVPSRHGA